MITRLVAVCLFLTSAVLAAKCASGQPSVSSTTSHYESDKHRITLDVFAPKSRPSGKKLPAVILLHGFDGTRGKLIDYAKYATDLASHGYIVLLPHYFESTHTSELDPLKFWAEIGKTAPTWLKASQDAIDFAAKQPEIDEKRIGLLGFSIGSYIAIYTAAQDKRVAAVVEYFGGVLPGVDALMSKRPPTLILHGDADKIINVSEAKRLALVCTDADIENELKIYKGQGHGFYGPDEEDARRRTVAWFDQKMTGK